MSHLDITFFLFNTQNHVAYKGSFNKVFLNSRYVVYMYLMNMYWLPDFH